MEGEVSDQYDEYHESKEDLTSASSSDSLDDEQQGARGDYNHRKKVQNRPAMTAATISGQERPPLWSSSSNLNSKFAVWKDNPGSIQDRRQRFFQQMGFKNLRGEHRFGHGFGSLSKSVSRTDPEIKDSDAADRLTVGRDITLENVCKKQLSNLKCLLHLLHLRDTNNFASIFMEEPFIFSLH
jgi:hypothetical protein